MNKVLACIDRSFYSRSVCEYAIWAALRLGAQLEFLHVLNRRSQTGVHDLSGSIGMDSQDNLLSELTQLDERRNKVAQQHGRQMLGVAVQAAREQGAENVEQRLRHGTLVDTLIDMEKDVRMFVLGKRGEHANFSKLHVGSELERAVRAVHRPLLVASRQFKPIDKFLIAFDGSETMRKGVDMIAAGLLFHGLSCHLVMTGTNTADARSRIQDSMGTRKAGGSGIRGSQLHQDRPCRCCNRSIRHCKCDRPPSNGSLRPLAHPPVDRAAFFMI